MPYVFLSELFIHSLLKNKNLWQPKKITITASSPHSRYTDPKVLVSRTYQVCYIDLPSFVNELLISWMEPNSSFGYDMIGNMFRRASFGKWT